MSRVAARGMFGRSKNRRKNGSLNSGFTLGPFALNAILTTPDVTSRSMGASVGTAEP